MATPPKPTSSKTPRVDLEPLDRTSGDGVQVPKGLLHTAAAPGDDDFDSPLHNRTLQVEIRTRLKVRRCKLTLMGRKEPDGPKVALSEIVSEKERIRIGTHSSNDLVVDDRTASRQHCELQYTDRGYLLIDLDSTNGTFVDGKQVERAFLFAGATLTIGTTEIVFTPVNEEI